MSARLYPVAASAEAALHAPLGLAARESEAAVAAGGPVDFRSELVGPAFETREAALELYAQAAAGGGAAALQPWCELRPVAPEGRPAPRPIAPINRDGVRWPAPPQPARTLWRLAVTYWRPTGAEPAAPLDPARKLRRTPEGANLEGEDLKRLSAQPLRAVRPQQPLDVGLFEAPRPEAPGLTLPDE